MEILTNERAVTFLREKQIVSPETFGRLNDELRMRAFTVAGIDAFNSLQICLDAVASVPAGGSWEEARRTIAVELLDRPGFFDPESEDAEGQIGKAIRHAEQVLRTNVFQAYAVGQWTDIQDTKAAFPWLQYVTVGDDRVRDAHAALDGLVVPVDSPFWETHFPPWDWGCRCEVAQLTDDEVEEIRQAEAELPGDRKLVMEGALLDRLETQNRVMRAELPRVDLNDPERAQIGAKGGGDFSVAPPAERDPEKGYSFKPGSFALSFAAISAGWSATVRAEFVRWAKKAKPYQGAKMTVGEWLEVVS